MPEPWETASRPGQPVHVMPTNDWQPHVTSHQCWCHPRFQDDVWVHNSMDRREDYETGKLRLN